MSVVFDSEKLKCELSAIFDNYTFDKYIKSLEKFNEVFLSKHLYFPNFRTFLKYISSWEYNPALNLIEVRNKDCIISYDVVYDCVYIDCEEKRSPENLLKIGFTSIVFKSICFEAIEFSNTFNMFYVDTFVKEISQDLTMKIFSIDMKHNSGNVEICSDNVKAEIPFISIVNKTEDYDVVVKNTNINVAVAKEISLINKVVKNTLELLKKL
jgi:hypothetical protein